MSDTVRQKAEHAKSLVDEVTSITLPEPEGEIVPLEQADAPVSAEIRARMDEIDISDTGSIVNFGSGAQAELQEISQAMHGKDAEECTRTFVDYWNSPGYFDALPAKIQALMVEQGLARQ